MELYAMLSRLLMLLVVLYGISVPLVIARSVVERRRMKEEERARYHGSSWTEV